MNVRERDNMEAATRLVGVVTDFYEQ